MTELVKQTGKLVLAGLLAAMILTASVGFGIWLGRSHSPLTQTRSLAPTVTELERIGELATTRVHVTDVLFAEGEGYRGSWLIKGDALLSCDMSQARIVNVQPEQRTATIRLPPPRVVSARVDHEKTRAWSVEKTTWLPWKVGDQGILRDAAMYHAQHLVEAAAGSERHLSQAQSQTGLLIRQLYEMVDWTVDVEWD